MHVSFCLSLKFAVTKIAGILEGCVNWYICEPMLRGCDVFVSVGAMQAGPSQRLSEDGSSQGEANHQLVPRPFPHPLKCHECFVSSNSLAFAVLPMLVAG